MNAWLLVAALLLLWFVLCRFLSNEWSINEQYNYGWFVPFFALFLFWQRWEATELCGRRIRNRSRFRKSAGRHRFSTFYFRLLLLFLLLPLRVFEIGNPDWRPLGWLHAAIVVGLTFLVVWLIGGKMWVRHFFFPIAFIFIAVPWVTPIEAPIVQGLMRTVASVVCEAVNLCGIPAQLEGSVIRVNTGLVGVNEACSGVRSLQTSIDDWLALRRIETVSDRKACCSSARRNCDRARGKFPARISSGLDCGDEGPFLQSINGTIMAGYSIVIAVFIGTFAIASWLGA